MANLSSLIMTSLILVIYFFMGSNLTATNEMIRYLMGASATLMDVYVMCSYSEQIRIRVASIYLKRNANFFHFN